MKYFTKNFVQYIFRSIEW